MLARTLKMAFWVFYDHLGKLLAVNSLCTVAMAFPALAALGALQSGGPGAVLGVGAPAVLVLTVVLGPLAAAGLAHMIKGLIETRDGTVTEFFRGIRAYGVRALGLGVVYSIGIAALGASVWFYAVQLGASMPWLGYALSAIAFWALAFALLTGLIVMPTLVQKKEGLVRTLKLAALLVLDNPLFLAGLAAQLVALTVIAALIWPLALFFHLALTMAVVTAAYEMLARKYAHIEIARAKAAGGVPSAASVAAAVDDADDDYLNRGFRDFLFPWKG